MNELEYDLTSHASKSLNDVPPIEFDVAVTMGCGDACPLVATKRREDWQIPDPRELGPAEFRDVRDLIGPATLTTFVHPTRLRHSTRSTTMINGLPHSPLAAACRVLLPLVSIRISTSIRRSTTTFLPIWNLPGTLSMSLRGGDSYTRVRSTEQ